MRGQCSKSTGCPFAHEMPRGADPLIGLPQRVPQTSSSPHLTGRGDAQRDADAGAGNSATGAQPAAAGAGGAIAAAGAGGSPAPAVLMTLDWARQVVATLGMPVVRPIVSSATSSAVSLVVCRHQICVNSHFDATTGELRIYRSVGPARCCGGAVPATAGRVLYLVCPRCRYKWRHWRRVSTHTHCLFSS